MASLADTPVGVETLISAIEALPQDWHTAGHVDTPVLRAICRHTRGRLLDDSVETGSGRTTLLLSHLSRRHRVFAIEGDNRSITAVRTSPLLKPGTVEFVEGPTQRTLPRYVFNEPLQFVLIDGPHGYPFPELEYYFLYQHLEPDGLLLIDDLHIPTISRLFEFIKEDEMFRLLEVVGTTAFFQRTDAPLFDPYGDGWWLQNYNKRRHPVESVARKWQKLWGRNSRRALRVLKRLSGV